MSAAIKADERLRQARTLWEHKPVLRLVYADFYDRLCEHIRPGTSLEIGGGSGNLPGYVDGVVSTDLVVSPWLDAAADAERLPFADASFDNVVMVDVLHHLAHPGAFLDEAARVLRSGGRVLMIEPAITPASYPVYKWLHPEPVEMRDDPYNPRPVSSASKDPFDSNQAIPTLIFGRRGRATFARLFPDLKITEVRRFALWAYPLSGGFKSWSLVPTRLAGPLLHAERRLEKLLGRLLGFRVLIVLTRAERGGA